MTVISVIQQCFAEIFGAPKLTVFRHPGYLESGCGCRILITALSLLHLPPLFYNLVTSQNFYRTFLCPSFSRSLPELTFVCKRQTVSTQDLIKSFCLRLRWRCLPSHLPVGARRSESRNRGTVIVTNIITSLAQFISIFSHF